MNLIQREPASHWYLPDGTSFHEVPRKDGMGKRAATLADARKVGALPSVTNVLGVLAKPGLDAWKIEQGIMAALTLPRLPEEPLDAFARRVVVDMDEQVDHAADFGTAIHSACEQYARTRELPAAELLPYFQGWKEWFDTNVQEVVEMERVCVHAGHGFAGRMDMLARLCGSGGSATCQLAVIDFKTQKVRRSALGRPLPVFYEAWPLQLAAYREGLVEAGVLKRAEDAALVSIVIDSTQPGPIHSLVWPANDYFGTFKSALELWRYVKAYDPRSVARSGLFN